MPKVEPPSLQGSRAIQRCEGSSKPIGTRTGPKCSPFCPRPLTLAVFTASRLADNNICGHWDRGKFVVTTEGIIALCEGLKGSALTSLGCAAATPKSLPVPLTSLLSHHPLCVLFHSIQGNNLTKIAEDALQDARWSLVGHEWRRSTTHLTGSRSDTDEESGRDDDF